MPCFSPKDDRLSQIDNWKVRTLGNSPENRKRMSSFYEEGDNKRGLEIVTQ